MGNFFILNKDVENHGKDAMLTGESLYLSQFQNYFLEGRKLEINEIRLPILFMSEKYSFRGRLTDNLYMEQIDGIVISNKAKEFLSCSTENLQFLTFKIIDDYSNNEEVMLAKMQGKELDYESVTYKDYYIANIVGLTDCVNHEASDLEYFTPRNDLPDDLPDNMRELMSEETDNDIDFIKKLVLDETKIPEDLKIFRLKDCPRILVFKEEIVKAIRKEKLTGFVFVPLDKYTDEIPDDDDDDMEEEEQVAIKTPAPKPKKVEKKVVAKKKEAVEKVPQKRKSSIVIKKIKRNR